MTVLLEYLPIRSRRQAVRLAWLALWLLALNPATAAPQELMEPEEAFQVDARMASTGAVQVTWRIAKDHYMYRQAFSVNAMEGGVTLGQPRIPGGTRIRDDFFGEVEIHEGETVITVPVETIPAGVEEFAIQAIGQGCNKPVGVCYPPVAQTATIRVADAQTGAPQSLMSEPDVSPDAVESLKTLLDGGTNQVEFLHPDEAFSFEVTPMGPGAALARFNIKPGYYLYKKQFAFTSNDPAVEVTNVQLPEGVRKTDEYFGETFVFYDTVDAQIDLRRDAARVRDVSLRVAYQGCADDGICYPPIEKNVTFKLPGVADAAAAYPGSGSGGGGVAGGSFIWPVLLAFGSGVLLTFTPCVLPMIPILAGLLVGQGGGMTRMRGGGLASVYVLGTAVTYTAVGIVAGLTGDQLQAYFQNAWAIGFIAIVLTLMALSMFGVFELKMPSAIQTRLQHRATELNAGAFGGVFFMGVLSALIVGACVSPILISILGLAISRGDPLLGGAIMFAMALGMGLFLIAIGFGFGHALPKTGPWMKNVNYAFGLMLLAVVIYLLGAIPAVPVLFLWAALLIGTAVYVGVSGSGGKRSVWTWLRQGGAVVLVTWGVLAALGGLAGNRDVLRPVDLAALGSEAGEPAAHTVFERVSNPDQLERLMQAARSQGKPVMIDYYADWCVDCVRMEKSTFATPKVADTLNDEFVLIQVDVTDPNDAGTRAIKQSHGVFGPPAMLFFDGTGQEIESMRRYGYMDSDEFMRHIAPMRRG